ncbi:type VI secretion system baseplate subunit TssE [uncultured Desulfobacter sp.]|uniref:type VI secretion system baseplate subunit TssE n=1 Tax=uncultured Desulfobacter sp. TaxID=240139 RepID=UPI0029F46075|nr:type VI secretion system baseplate subunit TssE [uncultured Desulfobacter sp.]
MADHIKKEMLQPSLLERLKDDEPGKQTEPHDKSIMSFSRLRASVLQDLNWLLNAICFETGEEELKAYPEVRKSVFNFGIRNFSGLTAGSKSDEVLERAIEEAILNFEPRIIPQSLRVHVVGEEELDSPDFKASHYDEHRYPNIVVFKIEGDLWAEPMPEHLYLKSVLDLELGQIEVKDDT